LIVLLEFGADEGALIFEAFGGEGAAGVDLIFERGLAVGIQIACIIEDFFDLIVFGVLENF
jgi:hypothetical protein